MDIGSFLYTRDQAEMAYTRYFGQKMPDSCKLDGPLLQLQSLLLEVYRARYTEWDLDWRLGLVLYRSGMISPNIASNLNFWYRMNTNLVPEILQTRWDITPENYSSNSKKARIFGRARNYLGSVWWLVHLVAHGKNLQDPVISSEVETILSRMNTDNIVAIVERTGGGYPEDLVQEIVWKLFGDPYYHSISKHQDFMRSLMKINNAWLLNVIPELSPGGIRGYVDRLFVRTEASHD